MPDRKHLLWGEVRHERRIRKRKHLCDPNPLLQYYHAGGCRCGVILLADLWVRNSLHAGLVLSRLSNELVEVTTQYKRHHSGRHARVRPRQIGVSRAWYGMRWVHWGGVVVFSPLFVPRACVCSILPRVNFLSICCISRLSPALLLDSEMRRLTPPVRTPLQKCLKPHECMLSLSKGGDFLLEYFCWWHCPCSATLSLCWRPCQAHAANWSSIRRVLGRGQARIMCRKIRTHYSSLVSCRVVQRAEASVLEQYGEHLDSNELRNLIHSAGGKGFVMPHLIFLSLSSSNTWMNSSSCTRAQFILHMLLKQAKVSPSDAKSIARVWSAKFARLWTIAINCKRHTYT